MKALKLLTVASIAVVVSACSTTTVRSVQEMEANKGTMYIKYGEVVVQKELFSSRIISNDQKIAKCEESGTDLKCSSLNLTIDGTPLKQTKDNAPF